MEGKAAGNLLSKYCINYLSFRNLPGVHMNLFNHALLTPALVAMAAAPLAAQVKIHLKPGSLLPGQSAELHAFLEGDERQPDWTWSLPDPDNGRVECGADRIWRYVAAEDFLLAPRKVRVRVAPTDGSRPPQDATLTLCAMQPLDFLFQAGYHPGRLDEPVASLLAGDPGVRKSAAGKAQEARFKQITGLAWAGDHPDPDLAGKWLVVDHEGGQILAMDGAGTVRPWVDHKGSDHLGRTGSHSCFKSIAGVSVRPKGQGPWRAVLASPFQNVILAVDGKGQVTTLAGNPGVTGHQDGEAGSASFNWPTDVVAGLDGVVYVADHGNHCIRMIKDGMVSTLAGSRTSGWRDGKGDQALFERPYTIAQDPATGHLYVVDRHRVRRVTLAGEVTTLAGADDTGFEDWLSGPALPAGAGRLRGIPCLSNPMGLSVHRGRLYIADSSNQAVRVLDLDTFDLVTLAGDPEQEAFRPGPLRDGRPRDPGRFAALGMPRHMAFDDQGHCLVATLTLGRGSCIAELSLGGVLPPEAPAGESKAAPASAE
jgi:hypothetical protein